MQLKQKKVEEKCNTKNLAQQAKDWKDKFKEKEITCDKLSKECQTLQTDKEEQNFIKPRKDMAKEREKERETSQFKELIKKSLFCKGQRYLANIQCWRCNCCDCVSNVHVFS